MVFEGTNGAAADLSIAQMITLLLWKRCYIQILEVTDPFWKTAVQLETKLGELRFRGSNGDLNALLRQ